MSDLTSVRSEILAAEARIREAMTVDSPGARLDAVMLAYWHTPKGERDAFVAALVARLTLVRPTDRSPAPVEPARAQV